MIEKLIKDQSLKKRTVVQGDVIVGDYILDENLNLSEPTKEIVFKHLSDENNIKKIHLPWRSELFAVKNDVDKNMCIVIFSPIYDYRYYICCYDEKFEPKSKSIEYPKNEYEFVSCNFYDVHVYNSNEIISIICKQNNNIERIRINLDLDVKIEISTSTIRSLSERFFQDGIDKKVNLIDVNFNPELVVLRCEAFSKSKSVFHVLLSHKNLDFIKDVSCQYSDLCGTFSSDSKKDNYDDVLDTELSLTKSTREIVFKHSLSDKNSTKKILPFSSNLLAIRRNTGKKDVWIVIFSPSYNQGKFLEDYCYINCYNKNFELKNKNPIYLGKFKKSFIMSNVFDFHVARNSNGEISVIYRSYDTMLCLTFNEKSNKEDFRQLFSLQKKFPSKNLNYMEVKLSDVPKKPSKTALYCNGKLCCLLSHEKNVSYTVFADKHTVFTDKRFDSYENRAKFYSNPINGDLVAIYSNKEREKHLCIYDQICLKHEGGGHLEDRFWESLEKKRLEVRGSLREKQIGVLLMKERWRLQFIRLISLLKDLETDEKINRLYVELKKRLIKVDVFVQKLIKSCRVFEYNFFSNELRNEEQNLGTKKEEDIKTFGEITEQQDKETEEEKFKQFKRKVHEKIRKLSSEMHRKLSEKMSYVEYKDEIFPGYIDDVDFERMIVMLEEMLKSFFEKERLEIKEFLPYFEKMEKTEEMEEIFGSEESEVAQIAKIRLFMRYLQRKLQFYLMQISRFPKEDEMEMEMQMQMQMKMQMKMELEEEEENVGEVEVEMEVKEEEENEGEVEAEMEVKEEEEKEGEVEKEIYNKLERENLKLKGIMEEIILGERKLEELTVENVLGSEICFRYGHGGKLRFKQLLSNYSEYLLFMKKFVLEERILEETSTSFMLEELFLPFRGIWFDFSFRKLLLLELERSLNDQNLFECILRNHDLLLIEKRMIDSFGFIRGGRVCSTFTRLNEMTNGRIQKFTEENKGSKELTKEMIEECQKISVADELIADIELLKDAWKKEPYKEDEKAKKAKKVKNVELRDRKLFALDLNYKVPVLQSRRSDEFEMLVVNDLVRKDLGILDFKHGNKDEIILCGIDVDDKREVFLLVYNMIDKKFIKAITSISSEQLLNFKEQLDIILDHEKVLNSVQSRYKRFLALILPELDSVEVNGEIEKFSRSLEKYLKEELDNVFIKQLKDSLQKETSLVFKKVFEPNVERKMSKVDVCEMDEETEGEEIENEKKYIKLKNDSYSSSMVFKEFILVLQEMFDRVKKNIFLRIAELKKSMDLLEREQQEDLLERDQQEDLLEEVKQEKNNFENEKEDDLLLIKTRLSEVCLFCEKAMTSLKKELKVILDEEEKKIQEHVNSEINEGGERLEKKKSEKRKKRKRKIQI